MNHSPRAWLVVRPIVELDVRQKPKARNFAISEMVEIVGFCGDGLSGGQFPRERETDREFVLRRDGILDVVVRIRVARLVRYEEMADVVIVQPLLSVVANHVALIEAWNCFRVQREPYLRISRSANSSASWLFMVQPPSSRVVATTCF